MRYYEQIKTIKNYAKRVIERDTKKLNREDWIIIGKDITTNKEKLRPFLAKKQVMSNLEIANKAILDLLIQQDIKPERALGLYKEAEEIARTKENSGDLIKIADRYVELHDLKPQKVTISETRQGNSPDYNDLLKHKQTVTITKTVNSSDNQTQANND